MTNRFWPFQKGWNCNNRVDISMGPTAWSGASKCAENKIIKYKLKSYKVISHRNSLID